MGLMGKVSKNAVTRHIAKPAPPIKLNPASRSPKKIPPKLNVMQTVSNESLKLKRSVLFSDGELTFFVGEEKGARKATVEITYIASPRYQSLYSVQTPCLLAYTVSK